MGRVTTPEVVAATGLSFRQVDYWCRVGLISPSARPARGSGDPASRGRLWSAEDVARLCRVRELIDEGYRPRAAIEKAWASC